MNLVGIVVAWLLSMNRPLINADYILLYLLSASRYRRPGLTVGLACALLALEWLIVINLTLFNFDWRDLLELASGDAVPKQFFVVVAAGIAAYMVIAAAIAYNRHFTSSRIALVLTAATVACFGIERIQRYAGASPLESDYVYSPTWILINSLSDAKKRAELTRHFSGEKDARLTPLEKPSRVFSALTEAAADQAQRETVLVLVESWGGENEAQVRQLLSKTLLRRIRDRKVEVGFDDAFGFTIHSEFRTLCNAGLSGFRVPLEGISSDCIPKLFERHGAVTKSFHGYSSRFYQRSRWYPKLGFTESYWKDDIARAPCNFAFSGTCDADTLTFYQGTIDAARRGFYYILTLDTHPPMGVNAAVAVGKSRLSTQLDPYPVYDALLTRTLTAIGDAVYAHPQSMFIVEGDHPPYLLLNTENGRRILKDKVPYVIIHPVDPVQSGVTTSSVSR